MRRGITSLRRDTRSPIPIPLLLSLDPVLVHRSKRMMRGGLELITILFHSSCQPDDNNHAFHSIFPPISPASLSHSLMTTFVASPSPSPPSPHITIYLSPIIVIVHRPSHYTSNIPLAGPSFSAPRLPCALFVVARSRCHSFACLSLAAEKGGFCCVEETLRVTFPLALSLASTTVPLFLPSL